MSENIVEGDYVLAMSYSDGSCFDPWEIGFYNEYKDAKHYLIDNKNRGFYRVKKISRRTGDILLKGRHVIEICDKSMLFWCRNTKLLEEMIQKGVDK